MSFHIAEMFWCIEWRKWNLKDLAVKQLEQIHLQRMKYRDALFKRWAWSRQPTIIDSHHMIEHLLTLWSEIKKRTCTAQMGRHGIKENYQRWRIPRALRTKTRTCMTRDVRPLGAEMFADPGKSCSIRNTSGTTLYRWQIQKVCFFSDYAKYQGWCLVY